MLVAPPPPQPADIATLCSSSSASHASDGHEHTTAPCVLPQPPPGLEKYARQYASHGKPGKAAPVRPRLCTSNSVTLPQPHVSTGTHPVRSATTYKSSASTRPCGNPQSYWCRSRALVLPMVKFGQSKPDGLGHIVTADSDLMHHQDRLSVLQWESRAGAQESIFLRRPVEGSMRLFFKKPVIMFRTSPISLLRILVTRTLLSCSTRTTFEPDTTVLAFRESSTSKGTWGIMVLRIVRALLRRPFTCRDTNCHILLSTHPQCCCQET